MARTWRSPALIMMSYLILQAVAGPTAATGSPHPHLLDWQSDGYQLIIAAFLSWRVIRGGRLSRGLLVTLALAGLLETLTSSALQAGSLVAIGLLGIYLAQIALLVSTQSTSGRARSAPIDPASPAR